MREDWKYLPLGEIVAFDKRFKGIDRSKQINIVTFKHVSAELLKSLQVEDGGVKLLATGLFEGYTTNEKAKEYINHGEVITIPTGGNANIKYYKGNFVDSGNILAIAKTSDNYLKYIWYYLLYQNEFLESCFKGTGIKHPYMPDIWNLKVPLPSFDEQESLVSLLDTQFAKIDALKANAASQLQAAKDLFQTALKQLLTPQKGWEAIKLKDLAHYRRGSFPQPYGKKEWYDGDGAMPFVQVAELQEDDFNLVANTAKKISKVAQEYSIFVPHGTVLVSLQGSIGKVAITQYDSYVDRTLAIFIGYKREIVKEFFAYQLKLKFALEAQKARGTTIKTITKEEFAEFEIKIAPYSEQMLIIEKINSISEKVKALQANYDQTINLCNDLKQALLKSIFA